MFEITRYNEKFSREWDTVIRESVNGTFLSSREFLSYHPKERFLDHSLIVKNNNNIIALIPGCEINMDREKVFSSHAGSTYGGIIFNCIPSASEVSSVIDIFNEYLKAQGFTCAVLKQTPLIFHATPFQTIDFLLQYDGYEISQLDLTTAIDITGYNTEEDILRGCKSKTRNQCRIGYKKSLQFTRTSNYELFYDMLVKGLERHGARPVHTINEMKQLGEALPNNIELFAVMAQDKMVACCWAFKFGDRVFHTQYLTMDYEYSSYAPMNFLIVKLLNEAIKGKFKYFNFGKSTEEGGSVINWNLFKFKEGFGGSGILLPTYRKDLIK